MRIGVKLNTRHGELRPRWEGAYLYRWDRAYCADTFMCTLCEISRLLRNQFRTSPWLRPTCVST